MARYVLVKLNVFQGDISVVDKSIRRDLSAQRVEIYRHKDYFFLVCDVFFQINRIAFSPASVRIKSTMLKIVASEDKLNALYLIQEHYIQCAAVSYGERAVVRPYVGILIGIVIADHF